MPSTLCIKRSLEVRIIIKSNCLANFNLDSPCKTEDANVVKEESCPTDSSELVVNNTNQEPTNNGNNS